MSTDRQLLNLQSIRPIFNIVPDDVLRESERNSLNRMPVTSDWLHGTPLTDVMREIKQPVVVHRKGWEYAVCMCGLQQLGVVNENATAISVGAGTEPPLYYFANRIKRMVATDLYSHPDKEGKPEMIANPQKFAPFPYRNANLEVYAMPGDKLAFDAETFDFCFTLSSIEHFGSRDVQRASLNEIHRVLKVGGVACIITEIILTDHTDKEYFSWEELSDMFLTHSGFRLAGGDLDLRIAESLIRYPTNMSAPNVSTSPHIVLKRGDMMYTSFSMFLQKQA